VGALIVLVLVCIATAALCAWLVLHRARMAPGAVRYLRLPSALHVPLPTIHVGRWLHVRGSGPETPSSDRAAEKPEPPQPLSDEDIELQVRERLYGQRSRRR
jgi:hypothetical protein